MQPEKPPMLNSPPAVCKRLAWQAPRKYRLYGKNACVSQGCSNQVNFAGTTTGQTPDEKHDAITLCEKCSGQASISNTGCKEPRYGRSIEPSLCMMRPWRTASFQALRCRTNQTFAGHSACKAAHSRTRKVDQLPMSTCGRRGCTSALSHTKATCVRQLRRLLRFDRWAGS